MRNVLSVREKGNDMKKGISFLLVLMLCLPVFAIAGAESKISGSLRWAANEDSVEIWNQIIARLNEKYPNVRVEVSPFLDYTALNQNVLAAHCFPQKAGR